MHCVYNRSGILYFVQLIKCNIHGTTFIYVKFHLPCDSPSVKQIYIFLEKESIMVTFDGSVYRIQSSANNLIVECLI